MAKDPAARPTVVEVERQLTEIALAVSAEQEALKVAETQIFTRGRPRRAASRHSTLGGATAQRLPRPWRRGVAVAGGLGLVLLVAIGMLWARSRSGAEAPGADPPAPAAAAVAGPGERIRWTVQTEPPGASVLHIESGKVLGKTPLTVERVPEAGQAVLLLSHEGCADQQLILAKDRSVTVSERLKTLRPSASRAGSEAPRSEGRSDGSRRSSERSPRPSEPAAPEPSHTQQPRIVD